MQVDENKNYKEAQGKGAMNQVKNRRALGDIGNLVGALSVSCNVSKISKENATLQPCQDGRSLTRTYSANFHENGKPETHTWKTKQRRTNATRRPRNISVHSTEGPADEREPTLTALLTARSEAADAEMSDVADDSSVNIDEADIGNHLAVVDYVEDIYQFYRKAEGVNAISESYMAYQTDINSKMRSILVDWLIEVHYKFKLMPETLYLTVNIMDRFLSSKRVLRKDLQLVGVTAMLIASKYEEIWSPEIEHFVFISDKAFSREDVIDMEKVILNRLSFNLTVPTPYVFATRFLKAAVSDTEMGHLVFFLVELCLGEYNMIKYPPSLLAAAAIYAAQCTLQKSPLWSNALQRHSGYTPKQLLECAKMMVGFHTTAREGNLTVVHKKYSCDQFLCVALLRPAII